MEIAIVLGLLAVAILLFSLEKFPVDVITVGMLCILVFTGILKPQEAFKGFASDFIVILASIFVITGAFTETGVLDKLGSMMVKIMSRSRTLFLLTTMVVASAISAFMNNTTVTALVTGPVASMCKKLSVSPSKMLMPVAFASILGGTCTLIGTSTNVAISGYIESAGLKPFGFFEFTLIGILISATGIIYMAVLWKWILPDRKPLSYTEGYEIRQYLSEILVTKDSKLAGQLVFQSDFSKRNIRILKIIRKKEEIIPNRFTQIESEDILIVECKLDDLIKVKESSGLEVLADVITDTELQSDKIKLAEVLITPASRLINRTLKESKFRQNYDLVVLAIHRFDENVSDKIGSLRLKTGDLLLVQGTEQSINFLRNSPEFTVLGDFKANLFKERKGIMTAILFLTAVILGSLEIIPLSVGFLSAALLTVLTGALPADRVYRVIDWRLIVLIGGMTAFGTAMENSGASQFLAEKIISLFRSSGPIYVLGAFAVLTVLLTQPMSNAAAALVVLPVALQAAELLEVSQRTFALVIMLSASISLITPFEPSCILVYGPGRYKFMDYIKAGFPLTGILLVLILWLVPKYWAL